jgi:murein DD-endopeptidase MepM/ murein hydrolase activator NlpD
MGRDQGRMGRVATRLFRERQIYHRSDGIVRFVKLSTRTQMVMASVVGAALLWVAYASVNVVFKEQIIVSKETERRNQEAAYRRKLQTAETAYDEVNALNFIYAREFDATISGLKAQHETLRTLVENKGAVDGRLRTLAETLSATGAPGGQKIQSGNRVMVDPVGREPTPRQSRISVLREEALQGVMNTRIAEGIDDDILATMRAETAQLSARQVVLMASLEEDMRQRAAELSNVLKHTGVRTDSIVQANRIALGQVLGGQIPGGMGGPLVEAEGEELASAEGDGMTGQGGPFIPAASETSYGRTAARVSRTLQEMMALSEAVRSVPLSAPVSDRHRMTSRFGVRWDPVKRNTRAMHKGLDFAARHNTPLLATAAGRVSFAGTRNGFGRTVEIDHGNGFKTRFAHMSSIKVRAGQKVDLHDVVGLMGSSGRSTGTHLHYEILHNGRQVDPLRFIEAGRYVFES